MSTHFAVRTSVVLDRDGWSVRVRIEEPVGVPSPAGEIIVGPFETKTEADKQGQKIAKMVRQVLKLEKQ